MRSTIIAATLLFAWPIAPASAQAQSAPPSALFEFLFPGSRSERTSTGYRISHANSLIRADAMHSGWRIFLPNGERWEATTTSGGWRVLNAAGRAIEVTGTSDGTLRGVTFDGERREVRPIGDEFRADAGMDAYWDHVNREREKERKEPRGLKTRSRFLNDR